MGKVESDFDKQSLGGRMTHFKNVERVVRRILLSNLDPIGIRDVPQAQDEYDSYIPNIVKKIASGADKSELARFLIQVEIEDMGLAGDPARAEKVAEILIIASQLN